MKVVVLGGYGNFGARICRALAGDERIGLVVAGRDEARARGFAAELKAGFARMDAAAPGLAGHLRRVDAGLVIHTAGPFQDQGYGVAQAAAEAGCHYVDLADGRRFVCDFPAAMDAAFRTAGVCGIAGASAVPALSSAVADRLAERFGEVASIDVCIAPAQQAPRGEATLAGVLSYCGAPVRVWRRGRWQEMPGWSGMEEVSFARMQPRLGALCDIPDLELFPARYPGVRDVMFRAALEVGASQRAFAFLAALKRVGLLRSPASLAPLLHRASPVFDRLGSALGGMVVRVGGTAPSGVPLALAWHIAAGANHGPEIPCMAAILLARRLASGNAPVAGAHACMGLVPLEDFAPEFARWDMRTDLVEESTR